MNAPHKLKLLLAGIIAAMPFMARAQDTMTIGANMTLSAGTLTLGGNVPFTGSLSLSLSGGTLAPANSTLLSLSSGSTIDLRASAGSLTVASSTGTFSTGMININNFSPGIGTIQIGTGTGLTPTQLGEITLDGGPFGATTVDSAGNLSVVPEPGVTALLILGGLGFAGRLLRKRI